MMLVPGVLADLAENLRMSEASERPAIAQAPISVILLAQALATETEDALQSWRHYLTGLHRPFEIILLQETRPEVSLPTTVEPSTRTMRYDRATGWREAFND